jgi:hypothetical protein
MDEDPKLNALTKAIRALTVAVWCLCLLVVGQLALYGWSYVRSVRWSRQAMTTTEFPKWSGPPTPSRSGPDELSELNRFHELPPEEMVSHASVILLTTYQDDGKRNKAVVAEVLKQNPEVTVYYSVGDEYPMLSFDKKKDVSCGDGQVVFMVGSPAMMASSYSFTGGRIGGLGDMPLVKLREMVKQDEMAKQKKS